MLAEQALESAHLDQVWMIPTGCSYLKTKDGITILPGTERYDMVQRAIADNDRFRCLDIEIKRPGNSYSYETMEQLHREYPEHLFYFICGADCLFTMEQWKCADRLFAACEIIAAVRGDADMKGMQEKISQLRNIFLRRYSCSLFEELRYLLRKSEREDPKVFPCAILCRKQ